VSAPPARAFSWAETATVPIPASNDEHPDAVVVEGREAQEA